MSQEIQEAVQIIRVAFDGVEMCMKVGSGGIHAIKDVVEFIQGMLEYEKLLGKTTMKALLMKGGDLQILKVAEDDLAKVAKMAKKYGVSYAEIPKEITEQGMRELIFHTEAIPRVNMMIQKLGFGTVDSFEHYIGSSQGNKAEKLTDFLSKQKLGKGPVQTEKELEADKMIDNLLEKVGLFATDQKSISVEQVKTQFQLGEEQAKDVIKDLQVIGVIKGADKNGVHPVSLEKDIFLQRLKAYRELDERIRKVSLEQSGRFLQIVIDKDQLSDENYKNVLTTLPTNDPERAGYVWFRKDHMIPMPGDDRKLLLFLDESAKFNIFDKDGEVLEMGATGKKLFEEHFNKMKNLPGEDILKKATQMLPGQTVKEVVQDTAGKVVRTATKKVR